MKFYTISGSIYEVDEDKKLIRRCKGKKDPTSRQGKDGDWKSYVELTLNIGHSAMVFWNIEDTPLLEGNVFGGVPATMTSEVFNIERG